MKCSVTYHGHSWIGQKRYLLLLVTLLHQVVRAQCETARGCYSMMENYIKNYIILNSRSTDTFQHLAKLVDHGTNVT